VSVVDEFVSDPVLTFAELLSAAQARESHPGERLSAVPVLQALAASSDAVNEFMSENDEVAQRFDIVVAEFKEQVA